MPICCSCCCHSLIKWKRTEEIVERLVQSEPPPNSQPASHQPLPQPGRHTCNCYTHTHTVTRRDALHHSGVLVCRCCCFIGACYCVVFFFVPLLFLRCRAAHLRKEFCATKFPLRYVIDATAPTKVGHLNERPTISDVRNSQ